MADATRTTITTTLGLLADAQPGLAAVLALPLPVRHAYHVSKLARLCESETTQFFERRIALIRQFGTERPAPSDERQPAGDTVFTVPAERAEAFTAQLNELRAIPVTIPWAPITMPMLEGQTIAGQHLVSLGPLLDDAPAP